VLGKSNASGVDNDQVIVQFNADTGANYGWARDGSANASAFSDGGGVSRRSAVIGYVSAATSTANYPGWTTARLPGYAGTTWNKNGMSLGLAHGNGSIYQMNIGYDWNNTAAITAILVKLSSASSFVNGTTVNLYGVKYYLGSA
jgi:hypothetical protein